MRLSKRSPNPDVVALAAVVVSLLRILPRGMLCMRHRLVCGLRLAAGLRAVSQMDAGRGQTASAEAVQGNGGRVPAGKGVLEVAHFRCGQLPEPFHSARIGFGG